MTTFAMVLGVMPLILSTGAGAKARFSMGLVIATGMSIGTIFTLFVVPMFYTFLSSRTAPGGRRQRRRCACAAPSGAGRVTAAAMETKPMLVTHGAHGY